MASFSAAVKPIINRIPGLNSTLGRTPFSLRSVPNFMGQRSALQLKRPSTLNMTGREAVEYIRRGGVRALGEIAEEAAPYLMIGLAGFLPAQTTLAAAMTKKAKGEISQKVDILNERGFHARASGSLIMLIKGFGCSVYFEAGGVVSEPNDPLSAMALFAPKGSKLKIIISGERAKEAMDAAVQYAARKFEEEEFDPRIAAPPAPLPTAPDAANISRREITILGNPIVRGIIIGRALKIQKENIAEKIPVKNVNPEELPKKIEDVERAFDKLAELINMTLEEANLQGRADTAGIYSFLRASLPALREGVISVMEENLINSRGAFDIFIEQNYSFLKDSSDALARSRYQDLLDLRDHFLKLRYGLPGIAVAEAMDDSGSVIIGDSLDPLEASIVLSRIHAAGSAIVLEKGAEKTHLGIVTKDTGIVSLFGVQNIMNMVNNGDTVIVDSVNSIVIVRPTPETLKEYKKHLKKYRSATDILLAARDNPVSTLDGRDIHIGGNVESARDARDLFETRPNGGIGLVRTEFFYMRDAEGNVRSEAPGLQEQVRYFRSIFSAADSAPTIIRTLDVGGGERDKKLPYFNPPLPSGLLSFGEGSSGISLCLDEIYNKPFYLLFREQIKAILIASDKKDDVTLIFPMVKRIEQFNRAVWACNDVLKELKEAGILNNAKLKFGIMVETPEIIEDFESVLRGKVPIPKNKLPAIFSIGSNDLTEIALGVKRGSPHYDELNPIPFGYLKRAIKIAVELNIPACLCGDMASKPTDFAMMMGLGMVNFSLPKSSVDHIRYFLQNIKGSDCARLADDLSSLKTVEEIRRYIRYSIKKQIESGAWPLDEKVVEVFFKELFSTT